MIDLFYNYKTTIIRKKNSFQFLTKYLILFMLACTFLGIGAFNKVNIYDEGFAVYGAERVLAGQIPYRDFWTIYSPGQFYTLSSLFKIFGVSLLVERVYDALVRFIISVIIFNIVKQISTLNSAFFCWVIVLSWLGTSGYYAYALFPALLFILLGVYFVFKFLSRTKFFWLFISGLSIGIATIFRHDLGFYSFLSISIINVLIYIDSYKNQQRKRSDFILNILKLELPFIAGVSVVILPVALFLVIKVPLTDLWQDLFVFPATSLHRFRGLPFPDLVPNIRQVIQKEIAIRTFVKFIERTWMGFYIPPLILLMTGIVLVSCNRKNKQVLEKMIIWKIVLLIILGGFLFIQSLSRADRIHFLPVSIIALILSPTLILLTLPKEKPRILVVTLYTILLLTSFFYYFEPLKSWEEIAKTIVSPTYWNTIKLNDVSRASFFNLDPNQVKAIHFIQDHVPKSEKIYVGNIRHDRIFWNDILFYFLADRQSATKYYELYPGVATTFPIQEKIINDLIKNNIQYIVLYSGLPNYNEPNESSISSGILILDKYIRENYILIKYFSDYTIWIKH